MTVSKEKPCLMAQLNFFSNIPSLSHEKYYCTKCGFQTATSAVTLSCKLPPLFWYTREMRDLSILCNVTGSFEVNPEYMCGVAL